MISQKPRGEHFKKFKGVTWYRNVKKKKKKKKGPGKSPLGLVVQGEGRALSEQVEKQAEKWSRGELMETMTVHHCFERKRTETGKSRKKAVFFFRCRTVTDSYKT